MTRKHYIAMADAIRDILEYQKNSDGPKSKEIKRGAIHAVTEALANVMANGNPNFNRAVFMSACGFNQ